MSEKSWRVESTEDEIKEAVKRAAKLAKGSAEKPTDRRIAQIAAQRLTFKVTAVLRRIQQMTDDERRELGLPMADMKPTSSLRTRAVRFGTAHMWNASRPPLRR
jgi:hypothetical protein